MQRSQLLLSPYARGTLPKHDLPQDPRNELGIRALQHIHTAFCPRSDNLENYHLHLIKNIPQGQDTASSNL